MTPVRRSPPTIGIVGIGYMGIATGLAFARHGRRVFAYDVNPQVRASVARGESPYREPGLSELLRSERRRGRFSPVGSMDELVAKAECIFLCVPTPPRRRGSVDLRPLRAAARQLGTALRAVDGYRVVVVKSTVVPGTTQEVVTPTLRRSSHKSARQLGIAVNPEFLSEGRMVRDALAPARIVLGVADRPSGRRLRAAYAGFAAPVLELSLAEAELVKHASNGFLALKVSYANELSRWTERLGGNVDAVAAAMGADPRIGPAFLRAGPGFGGSCFEKDLRAFARRAEQLGIPSHAPRAVLAINAAQTEHAVDLIRAAVPSLRGKKVAVLGLAFKAGTDDVRESRAFPVIDQLVAAGARVRAHDPAARENFEREWRRRARGAPGAVTFTRSVPEALRGADLAVVQVDWPEYRRWPSSWTRAMRRPLLVDLRRGIPRSTASRAALGVVALGVGRAAPPESSSGAGGTRRRSG